MGVKTIDANMLKNMFLAGAKRIESKKEWINELNVFPVPDGDTGTNMTMTIMSAAREVSALTDPDLESLSKAISQGALRGARGNSGVILSQLFRGFTRPIKDEKVMDGVIAAEAFQKAERELAYKAVMKPKRERKVQFLQLQEAWQRKQRIFLMQQMIWKKVFVRS